MQSSLVPIRETCRAPRLLFLMIPYWFQMHYKACNLNIKCLSVVHSLWIKGNGHPPKPYYCCWAWSTQRCPARTQCLSWWEGNDHPRRSASGRQRTWSTPDGKPCPAHASSSQTLGSSFHRRRRDRPGQKAWVDERTSTCYWEEDGKHLLALNDVKL